MDTTYHPDWYLRGFWVNESTPESMKGTQMRIYRVTFDGREKSEDEWTPNWESVRVSLTGGARKAIRLAIQQVDPGKGYEVRPAEVQVLAEDD